MISKFTGNSKDEIELIKTAAEDNDFAKISGILHRLKGSMSYFAPIECQKLLLELERMALGENGLFLETLESFEKAHEELLIELNNISKHI